MSADIPLHALAQAIWSEAPADDAPAITRHPAFAVYRNTVLKGCVDWAKENGVALVTEEHMKIINDKRAKEKQKKK